MENKEIAVQNVLANMAIEITNHKIALEMANLEIIKLKEMLAEKEGE